MFSILRERLRQILAPLLWQAAALLAYIVVSIWYGGTALAAAVGSLLIAGVLTLLLLQLRNIIEIEELEDRRLWQMAVVAVAIWALARSYEAGTLVLTGTMPPIPSLADLLRLAGYLALMGGLALLPISKGQRFGRVRDFLDVLVVVFASLVMFYLIVIQSAMEVGIERPVLILWAGLPPALDITLALMGLRLRLLAQTRIERRYLGLLALAFMLRLPSDLALGYGLLRPERMLGHLTDLGWLLSPMAILLAAQLRYQSAGHGFQSDKVSAGWKRMASRMESLLPPFLVYLVAGFTLVSYWLIGELNWVGAISTAVLGVLLVARQGVIAGQAEMQQHAALVNAAADLAFICSNEGDLLLANPAMRWATGIDLAEEPKIGLADLLGADATTDILEQGVQGGWSGEVEFTDADGQTFPAALSVRPVPDERSHHVHLAGTAHNLTALKNREDDLRQALAEVADARQQLEVLNQSLEEKVHDRTQELAETVAHLEQLNEELKQLDQLKSEFVTLVSHELRGPLTNIRSGVELALSRSKDLPETAEETLRLVASETERLVSFVEVILDLSALEAGRFPLDLQPIPLAVMSRAVASRFPPDKSRWIQVDVDEDLPPVMADEQALTSILFHLMDNALKYAPGSPVLVTAERVEDMIEITVLDHGPGIPAAEREAVFDRFHRLDTSDAREVYGHGLGLYLSRQLLWAMQGEIQVGEHSEGARVVFWLPVASTHEPYASKI